MKHVKMDLIGNVVLVVLLGGVVLPMQVQGYYWYTVHSADDYLPDTVMHTSTDEGSMRFCLMSR